MERDQVERFLALIWGAGNAWVEDRRGGQWLAVALVRNEEGEVTERRAYIGPGVEEAAEDATLDLMQLRTQTTMELDRVVGGWRCTVSGVSMGNGESRLEALWRTAVILNLAPVPQPEATDLADELARMRTRIDGLELVVEMTRASIDGLLALPEPTGVDLEPPHDPESDMDEDCTCREPTDAQ